MEAVQSYKHWTDFSKEAWFHFTLKLARIERGMTAVEFDDIRSLFFESDLPSGIRRTTHRLIDNLTEPMSTVIALTLVLTGYFGLIDRGPCKLYVRIHPLF
jgi:hypothetical protein